MQFKPQPGPQEQYFLNPADILIYGGSSGGGKTYSLLLDPLRRIHIPGFTSVIFRRTYPEIENEGGLWDESEKIYPYLGGVPKETTLSWDFPKFSNTIKFAHMEYEKNKHNYQGSQICFIGFDELTHFNSSMFFYMLSRNRSTCGIRPYIRATCNPDAESWVSEFIAYWIDQDTGYPIPERSGALRYFVRDRDAIIWADSEAELREMVPYIPDEDFLPKSVTFIPAKLSDNPALLQKDPGYKANLLALNYVDRERLLGGNWKIKFSAGTMFKTEWFQFIEFEDLPINQTKMERVRSWDTAATEPGPGNPDPDYSAGVLMAEYQGRYYIFDLQHFRLSPAKTEASFLSTAELDGRDVDIILEQEPGSAGKREIDRFKTGLFKGYSFRGKTSSGRGDKVIRAKPFSAAVENGLVYLVRGPWNAAFISELSHFPDPKFHDDICFVAGTLISTNKGHIPIEKIDKSYKVLTRAGYKEIEAYGLTSESSEVISLICENGNSITATRRHPIWVRGKGFIPLEKINIGDCVLSEYPMSMRSNSMELFFEDIPIQNINLIEDITLQTVFTDMKALEHCIRKYGNSIMGQFLKDMISIIKMETHSIIKLKTLNVFNNPSTIKSILINYGKIKHFHKKCETILIISGPLLKNGIAPKRALNGTQNTENAPGKLENQLKKYVNNAEKNLTILPGRIQGVSVPLIALQNGTEKIFSKPEYVNIAGLNSQHKINTRIKLAVQQVVRIDKDVRKEKVYNLSVKEVPEYFANGILVHNCDASANAFEYLSRKGARGKIDLSKIVKQRNAPVIPKRII